ncbi:hypothetical protein T11_13713 [Trichinella zimbabwensis]|uniref:Uncharacterized protein n=1 Tax=Trichinella zimbabwensis TaxID=268475 RepID=A0A0V1I280_9BILA|nr:hypothetical protein T11_13713 [Trichinella zimbabwensis]
MDFRSTKWLIKFVETKFPYYWVQFRKRHCLSCRRESACQSVITAMTAATVTGSVLNQAGSPFPFQMNVK